MRIIEAFTKPALLQSPLDEFIRVATVILVLVVIALVAVWLESRKKNTYIHTKITLSPAGPMCEDCGRLISS